MADGAKVAFVAVLIAIVAATTLHLTESAVTCKSVVSSLTPCATYLIRGGQVPTKCCNGVQSLYKDANTKEDRQMACRCMEQASKLVPGINEKYANMLPEKCDVHIPYKITPTFDCSTYVFLIYACTHS
ncbi:putative plant lipid transfer protein/Par allergen [Helianthus anomalus]